MRTRKLTVTEKHLDEAIAKRGTGGISSTCVMAVASRKGWHKRTRCGFNFVVIADKFSVSSAVYKDPSRTMNKITHLFDAGKYEDIRPMLPLTIEYTKVG